MADFKNAKSIHHKRYLRHHEELNYFVKIATVSIDHLKSFSDDPKTLAEKISALLGSAPAEC